MNIFKHLRAYVSRLYPKKVSESSNVPNMLDYIELWAEIYKNRPPWTHKNKSEPPLKRLNLASAICAEYARLITIELNTQITGNTARAKFLQENYENLLRVLRPQLEYGCAVGGVIFKPYVANGKIYPDCCPQNSFFPAAYDNEMLTGAVFCDTFTQGRNIFTRFENHEYKNGTHRVTNRVFVSTSPFTLGRETELSAVAHWSQIDKEFEIPNVDRPLFGYFKPALANQIDVHSPLGVSVFSRAADDLEAADRQKTRLDWEYQAGQLAIDASEDVLRLVSDKDGNLKYSLPESSARIFRKINAEKNGEAFYNVFNPTLRDSNYAAGLDDIKREIEFKCSLAYGTLSKLQTVEKTAEEIRSSKQRSYTAICDCQQNLKIALDDYIYAMDRLAEFCGLTPSGEYTTQHIFGDGILEDVKNEQQIRLNEVSAGILDPIEYLKWRYEADDEQARRLMPQVGGFFGGEE